MYKYIKHVNKNIKIQIYLIYIYIYIYTYIYIYIYIYINIYYTAFVIRAKSQNDVIKVKF